MSGDAQGPLTGATGELHAYRSGEFGDEPLVLVETSLFVALAASFPHIAVGQALLLGRGDGVGFSEDSLPLVPLARPAPLHDDGGQPAGPPCATRERGVAARQELQMTEIRAVHAQRAGVIHRQELTTEEL
jgi:hypothetical protein